MNKTSQSWLLNLLLSYTQFSFLIITVIIIVFYIYCLYYLSLNSQLIAIELLFLYMLLSSKQLGNVHLAPQSGDITKGFEEKNSSEGLD